MNFQFTSGTKEEILEKIVNGVEKGRVMTVVTPNLEMWALAKKDEEFLQALREADIRVCDGMGLWLLSGREGERYTGWELSMDLIREAKSKGWRVMLLGGGFGVARQAASVIASGSWIKGVVGYKSD
jgi:UDP-N-acetyl-D-mannosaminuronic acid transferase (WecB/TagA/CpsF family)